MEACTPLNLQHIRFLLREHAYIEFLRHYKPAGGPLCGYLYPLHGLWVYNDIVIKAFFKAEEIPIQDGELILHRYEAANVIHPSQAKYKYFTIPGYGGMILHRRGYEQMGLEIGKVFGYLDKQANMQALEQWQADNTGSHDIVEVPDQLGNFSTMILVKPLCTEGSNPV